MGCGSSSQNQVAVTEAAPVAAPTEEKQAQSAGNPASSSSSSSSSESSTFVFPDKMPRIGPSLPVSILADSYKASHFKMYPEADLMVAYGEFRCSYNKDPEDNRFVFFGIRYIIENFVGVQWTKQDVEMADAFYKTHNAGFTPYPFPKDLFMKFVNENNGYFPVRIEALPEGTVANVHTPVYQIFATKEYSRLITFLETILTQLWYPSTVATLSRRTRDLIEDGFKQSVDESAHFLIDSRLHDFGFRGCTCVEQSILGGTAHLLNFSGSDTMSACYYAQFYLNKGKPVAQSIPATEHSVMTSWRTEREAIQNMIHEFGGENKVFAVVMDSYDYSNALNKVLPSIAPDHVKKGGLIVLRPDSGDPVDCVVDALVAGEKAFGVTKNLKGYKIVNGMSCIQGDGINYHTVKAIIDAVQKEGYSVQNVAFGMGGGLLQRVNRDTMSFATKLSFIKYKDGTTRDVMKRPKTDGGKFSLPGILKVVRKDGRLFVLPRGIDETPAAHENELKVVYDMKPLDNVWDDFNTIQARVRAQWGSTPKLHDVVSDEMKEKIEAWSNKFDQDYDNMIKELDAQHAQPSTTQQAETPAS